MSQIRGRNTKPEILLRKMLHANGFRYKLHVKDLPGKPDIVFPSRRKVVFVHGCFWHMHNCEFGNVVPQTNKEFWQSKRRSNVERDKSNVQKLRNSGWEVIEVWECELRKPEQSLHKVIRFLQ